MALRRVRVNLQSSQTEAVAATYELLQQLSSGKGGAQHRTVFDVTSGEGNGMQWYQFLSEAMDVPGTLAILGSRPEVQPLLREGCGCPMRIVVSEVLTTVPTLKKHDRAEEEAKGLHELLNPRSRRTIHEIFQVIDGGCHFSFDYLAMLAAASAIATVGLVTDSSVSVVASMLLSPLMAPILCITFGLATAHPTIVARGCKVEFIGVVLALAIGLLSGLILALWYGPRQLGMRAWSELGHAAWSGDSPFHELISENATWPYQLQSREIHSRGSAASLVSGTLVAVPSGFGAVVAITAGGGINALVGVAIAAALLPPLVNSGLCLGLAVTWQLQDPEANWARDVLQMLRTAFSHRSLAPRRPPVIVSTAAQPKADDALADVGSGVEVAVDTTTIVTSRVDVDVFYIESAPARVAGEPRDHPYIVVALHGFWSFVLFLLNFVCIILTGWATFRIKGVSRRAADFPDYFPALPPAWPLSALPAWRSACAACRWGCRWLAEAAGRALPRRWRSERHHDGASTPLTGKEKDGLRYADAVASSLPTYEQSCQSYGDAAMVLARRSRHDLEAGLPVVTARQPSREGQEMLRMVQEGERRKLQRQGVVTLL